jgi:glycerol kinase
MEAESGVALKELRVDGGATRNSFLMQFQADILGKRVIRPTNTETTALGAAFAAGLATDYWHNTTELSKIWRTDAVYETKMTKTQREQLYTQWREAVKRSLLWIQPK